MSPAASLVLPRERHTVPAARALAEGTMRAAGVEPGVIDELMVAVSEACTNVVRHAGGDEYRIDVQVADDLCTIVVRDHGNGFDVPASPTMPAIDAEGGRGLALMRALVDDLEVTTGPGGGAVVTMVRSTTCA
jgi:serine/threonine-protein kinase RsbW